MKQFAILILSLVFAVAVGAIIGCISGCSLYTQQSPLPSAINMQADCTKTPGSLACDVYPILEGVCNGSIAVPITIGNFDQAVCVGLGYRTAPKSAIMIQK